jgi:hypothetical protein
MIFKPALKSRKTTYKLRSDEHFNLVKSCADSVNKYTEGIISCNLKNLKELMFWGANNLVVRV